MSRRIFLALGLVISLVPAAFAVITAPSELSSFIAEADFILVAKIENLDSDKGQMVLVPQDDLKAKIPFRRLPTVFRPDEDAIKLDHMPQLLKRLGNDVPMVLFVSQEGKKITTYGFTNGTWIQLIGTQTDKEKAVWVLTHGEPLLRKMYKGTTTELVGIVKDVLAGKAKAPKLDNSVESGFGPELPKKSTRLMEVPETPGTGDGTLFAVIPTIGLMGPLAILAILFPTVFGGVLILFRQWTAFITMFSINSMFYMWLLWKGAAQLDGTWWGTDVGVWMIITGVTFLCTLWAWRRQLHNLSQGVDALDSPARTEFIVLSTLAATCLAFIAGTLYFAPPPATDIVWNLTLVLTAGILCGLLYKIVRGFFEVMLPMATEGVMLGVSSVACLLVLAMLTRVDAGPSTGSGLSGIKNADAAAPQFKGEKWAYRSKRGGIFVSSPLIQGDQVFAASAHPTFKFGVLNKFDLNTGSELWRFNDDGSYKQPISSPAFADGSIFIGEGFHEDPNCKLYSVNATDGTKRWEYQTTSQTESTPVASGGKVYVGCGNDGFFCFAGDSPKVLWQFPEKASKSRLLRFGAGACVDDGRVYVGTGIDRLQKEDKGETAIFCLDAATGKELWKTPVPFPVWSTPVLHEGELFVAFGNGDVFDDAPEPAGAVYKLNPQTGAIVWKTALPNSVLQKPSVDQENLYVGCRDGACYALDRKRGKIVWMVNLGSPVIGTPALATTLDGKSSASVFALSDRGRIACLQPKTGLADWTINLEDGKLRFLAAPAVAVRATEGGEQRLLLVGGGDTVSGAKATLFCFEDFVPRK